MVKLNPYLSFGSNCEEAFRFYHSVFGGELTDIMRFKDVPPSDEYKMPEDEGEKVMHMGLKMGDNVLMGSDSPSNMGSVNPGNNISLSVTVDSEKEVNRIFNALAEGGKIIMPAEKTFWNAYFGMIIDKYGLMWMVSYDYNNA